ncbi:MAG: hypothetical protein P4L49_15330 [Desulfosporosinus sp.]|nr:hypothetical protein [Desulfosporosinus sp.]
MLEPEQQGLGADDELLVEIQGCVKQCKPKWVFCPCPQGGQGFIEDSLFIVRRHKIYWVVQFCKTGAIAFKEVSPQFMDIFSEIIIGSPRIYVEFDRCHRITEWITLQDKVCCLDKLPQVKLPGNLSQADF